MLTIVKSIIALSYRLVNCSDAASSLEVIHSFLQQQDSEDLLKHINALDRYISLKSMNVMKQTTIEEFFNNS